MGCLAAKQQTKAMSGCYNGNKSFREAGITDVVFSYRQRLTELLEKQTKSTIF